jgi:hypothetical protein
VGHAHANATPLRYTQHERDVVVGMFLKGVDAVSYDVLREELRELLKDRERLDKAERWAKQKRPDRAEFEIFFTRGETLRQAIDRTPVR